MLGFGLTYVMPSLTIIIVCFFVWLAIRQVLNIYDRRRLHKIINNKTKQITALALKYEAILRYVGEGIFTLDIEGKCEFVNQTSLRWLGHNENDLIGKDAHEVIHYKKKDGSFYPNEECPLYQMFTKHQYDFNSSQDELAKKSTDFFIRKDGSFMDIEYVATPLFDYDEKYIGAVLVWHPVSVHRKREKI